MMLLLAAPVSQVYSLARTGCLAVCIAARSLTSLLCYCTLQHIVSSNIASLMSSPALHSVTCLEIIQSKGGGTTASATVHSTIVHIIRVTYEVASGRDCVDIVAHRGSTGS
eukprot:6754-Heterococcus_DN1.PRE.5